MKDLVIFSSPLICALMATVLGLYVLQVIFQIIFAKNAFISKIVIIIITVLNALLQLTLFAYFVYIGTTTEELLFLIVASSFLAFVTSYEKGANGNGI